MVNLIQIWGIGPIKGLTGLLEDWFGKKFKLGLYRGTYSRIVGPTTGWTNKGGTGNYIGGQGIR